MIIAIDGPAGSGKGTLAKKLAALLDYAHLDTGTLYRKTALLVRAAQGDPADPAAAVAAAQRVQEADFPEAEIRSAEAGKDASLVAALPDVRAVLRDYQRDFAAHPPGGKAGAILDGRDIGTVICPDADAKLFVTASADVRARRRFKELEEGGNALTYEEVLAQVRERDARDEGRTDSPLKPAADAHLLDTSEMTIEGAFAAACGYLRARGVPVPDDAL